MSAVALSFSPPRREAPWAAALSAQVEACARRARVELVSGEMSGAALAGRVLVAVGEAGASCGEAPAIEVVFDAGGAGGAGPDVDRPWPVVVARGAEPVAALGRVLDVVIEVARGGERALHEVFGGAGTLSAHAGAVRLFGAALAERLARRLEARVGAALREALDEGRGWEAEDWELPASPTLVELIARAERLGAYTAEGEDELARAARAAAGEALRAGLVAADVFVTRLRGDVDRGLAAQGLAAVWPMAQALARLEAAAEARLAELQRGQGRAGAPLAEHLQPVAAARASVEASARRLDAEPLAVAGGGLLALGHGPGLAALGALAAGAVAGTWAGAWPGGGFSAAGLASAALVAAGVATGRASLRASRRRAERQLERAQADLAQVRRLALEAALAAHHEACAAPPLASIQAAARAERLRLEALAAAVPRVDSVNISSGAMPPSSHQKTPGDVDSVHIDLPPDLLGPELDLPVEPLLHRLRDELSDWRLGPPTLFALATAARAELAEHPPWHTRRDLADRLEPHTLGAARAIDAALRRLLPAGAPARRLLALPPALSGLARADLPADLEPLPLPSPGADVHLLVLWRDPA